MDLLTPGHTLDSIAYLVGDAAFIHDTAALYAFAAAKGCKVLCLAHVTNTMAKAAQISKTGENNGTVDALAVLGSIVGALAKG